MKGQGCAEQWWESPDENFYSRGTQKQRCEGDALAGPAFGKLHLEEALTPAMESRRLPRTMGPVLRERHLH